MSEEAGADAILKPPGFVSSKLDLIINEGETIRLPCIVTRYQMTVFLYVLMTIVSEQKLMK